MDRDGAALALLSVWVPGGRSWSSEGLNPVSHALCGQCSVPSAGHCWAATTTEGLLIYSLDTQLLFDPFQLDTSITPARVRAALREGLFTRALLMALRLNERPLVQEALEAVPASESASQGWWCLGWRVWEVCV